MVHFLFRCIFIEIIHFLHTLFKTPFFYYLKKEDMFFFVISQSRSYVLISFCDAKSPYYFSIIRGGKLLFTTPSKSSTRLFLSSIVFIFFNFFFWPHLDIHGDVGSHFQFNIHGSINTWSAWYSFPTNK